MDRPELPAEYEETAWNRLRVAIHAIQKNEPSAESLEVLYQVRLHVYSFDLLITQSIFN